MKFSRNHSLSLLIALGLLLLNAPSPAQETSRKADGSQQSSIVLLNVRITDERGRPASDVRQEDVSVFEDGVAQTISFFSKEEVPLSYGLLIDNSGSMRSQLDRVLDAGRLVVDSNRPGDETFIVRFVTSDNIQMVSGFTSSKMALFGSLDSMFVEGGQTAVIDAVLLSLDYAVKNRKGMDGNRRLALVLVTDGEDRASRSKRTELAERLHKEDIQIFAIGLTRQIEDKKSRDKATDLLKFLAEETGGRAFFPNSVSELRGIAEEITRDLRTQYLVGYIPAGTAKNNAFHKVQVKVAESQGKEKRVAVTRVGYIAAPRTNQ
jgi:Ca-activated chloride channel family protein